MDDTHTHTQICTHMILSLGITETYSCCDHKVYDVIRSHGKKCVLI
jgi:hypothetical protein